LFAELDGVRLRRDLPEAGPARGAPGTVHQANEGPPPRSRVEFCDAAGRTQAILSVVEAGLELQWSRQAPGERPASGAPPGRAATPGSAALGLTLTMTAPPAPRRAQRAADRA